MGARLCLEEMRKLHRIYRGIENNESRETESGYKKWDRASCLGGDRQSLRQKIGWVNKIRNIWNRNNICGDSEEEEEAGTVKHSVWRGTFIGQGVGSH